MKSSRNKTIDFPLEQGEKYLAECVSAGNCESVVNKTVIGDLFDAICTVPDESVDLLIADPPYNLDKDFHGNGFKALPYSDYVEYTRGWLGVIKAKLKKTASIYVCCDWKSSPAIAAVLGEFFAVRNRITWQREKGRGAKKNWKNGLEDIYFATVSDKYTFNLDAVKIKKRVVAPYKVDGKPKDWQEGDDGRYRNTCPSNFWDDISVPYWSMAENTAHPTQKPEKLIAKLVLASSNKGDLILDPFSGSGTTGVVAKKLGRNFIDIEKNPLYCAWAQYRLEKAEEDKTIQGFENGVFLERNYRA